MTTTALTWTAPVAVATPPRYFAYDICGGRTWSEIDVNAEPDTFDDRVVVQVDQVRDALKLTCCCYYSSEGRCELTISQPLGHALAAFAGLLLIDGELESGTVPPVAI